MKEMIFFMFGKNFVSQGEADKARIWPRCAGLGDGC